MSLIQVTSTRLGSYQVPVHIAFQYYLIADSIFIALISSFYPVVGLLADLKFSRYKTIISSIWMLVVGTSSLLLIDSAVLEFTNCRTAVTFMQHYGIDANII